MSTEEWARDRLVLRGYFDDDGAAATESEYWARKGEGYHDIIAEEERLFAGIFAEKRGGRFLEIGIGFNPVPSRIEVMVAERIAYTGLDLTLVCDQHRAVLEQAHARGLTYRLMANAGGSYLYNLIELARAGETFDVIYFDGHHTMYVDAGPMLLATTLLAPGGVFVVDDLSWSLSELAHDMYMSYPTWLAFRQMYNFEIYEPAQLRERHMAVLVDTVLVKRLGFVPDPVLACRDKAVLRRGPTA